MKGQITLNSALDQIEASSIRERASGFKNLKHVWQHNKHSSSVDVLNDAAHQKIYDVLFQVAIQEKSAWLKARTTTTQSSAEDRLSDCGNALRLAVEAIVRTVKFKAVRALLDHIIETLPIPGGRLCAPLALDYAKALVAILSHQPHVEHMKPLDWDGTTMFCIETIRYAQTDGYEQDDAVLGAESKSRAFVSSKSLTSQYKESVGSQTTRSLNRQVTEEMMTALCLLTAAPNAPIRRNAAELLEASISVLKTTSTVGRSHQAAFTTINHILRCIRTEDTTLTGKVATQLLRLVRLGWPSKPGSLRNQMLICLLYLRPFIVQDLARNDRPIIRGETSALLGVMRSEYNKRSEREQLHTDDLRLATRPKNSGEESTSVHTTVFALRHSNPLGEPKWAVAYIMASLCGSLDVDQQQESSSADDDKSREAQEVPRKRQKRTNESQSSTLKDILSCTASGLSSSRVYALQMLAFLVQQTRLTLEQLDHIMDTLSVSCSEESGVIASWAFLALASCASQRTSTDISLLRRWTNLWRLASRALGNASTCRAACHLLSFMLRLNLVNQSSATELLQSMVSSMDLHGPSVLADSVLQFLTQLVRRSQQAGPSTSNAAAEITVGWLFRFFTPSRFEDKGYASAHITYEVTDVIRFVEVILNHATEPRISQALPTWDAIAQAWLQCQHERDLLTYLLLQENDDFLHPDLTSGMSIDRKPASSPQPRTSCEALILSSLTAELQRTQPLLQQWLVEHPKSVSLDMFRSVCASCVVASWLANCHAYRDTRRQAQLQKQTDVFLQSVCEFGKSTHCGQDKIDILISISSKLLSGLAVDESRSEYMPTRCEMLLCASLSTALAARRSSKYSNDEEDDDDMIDFDASHESQESRKLTTKAEMLELKNQSAIAFSPLAVRSRFTIYVTAISMRVPNDHGESGNEALSSRIIDFILALPEPSILSSHDTISSLPGLGFDFSAEDVARLLEFCSETVLQSYTWGRSEVATVAVISLSSVLTPLWTQRDDENLFSLGEDLYSWYTSSAISSGLLSTSAQTRLADLLLRLCHSDPNYPNESDVPSVRTSLFELLRQGAIATQYHMASRISTIFGLFTLPAHPAIFNDLQQSLPAEADCLEGMAIRLLYFSTLATAWHSLLRECIYYMFETAGRVKQSSRHAALCISRLASTLNSKSSNDVFRLFAPQLLHTWLESHSLESLPYAAFGYNAPLDLLRENQTEIVAQLLMRGKDEGLQVLTHALDKNVKEICEGAFAKCAAYTISWDIAQSTIEPTAAASEARLRGIFGKEEYKILLTKHFPTIMGHFYISTQQEEGLASQQEDTQSKWLDRRPTSRSAMEEIRSYGHSTGALPPSQQPSFKSKFLCDQIERLCRRTGHNAEAPWEVSSLSLSLGMILDTADDAFGPLHMCLILRKLRLLICMSGNVALTGYPLETLLRSIRPFVSDSHCANDAIGILHYLLKNGSEYLKENSADLTRGLVLLLVLQMREHAGSKHDSTTQESQHQATVQRMESFCAWLMTYLHMNSLLTPDGPTDKASGLYDTMTRVRLPGNARHHTAESALLLFLLEQQNAPNPILTPSDGLEALLLLAERFEAPKSTAEDCLGDDEAAAAYAKSLAQMLATTRLNDDFVLWASAVIGRAYVSTGDRHPMRPRDEGTLRGSTLSGIAKSRAIVADRIVRALSSKDRFQASLAEHTLRKMALTFKDADECLAFENTLPDSIVPAIAAGSFGYQPPATGIIPQQPLDSHSLEQVLHPSPLSTVEEWTVKLCALLCARPTNMPILPALPAILMRVPGLAADLLPAIIHDILAEEAPRVPIVRSILSNAVSAHLSDEDVALKGKQRIILGLLLYLRTQPFPGETNQAERVRWLDVDPLLAADAAARCGMSTAALMFAESVAPMVETKRRGSTRASMSQAVAIEIPNELLLAIFKHIDEPDSFYGVEQSASLQSVLGRLEYERDGLKSLMFRSARMDSDMRGANLTSPGASGVIHSLSAMNLNSLTYALLAQTDVDATNSATDMMDAARKLEQWNIAPLEIHEPAATCFRAFQNLSRASNRSQMLSSLHNALIDQVRYSIASGTPKTTSHAFYDVLASLSEIGEVVNCSDEAQLSSQWQTMLSRQSWMQFARYEDCQTILSTRQTLFSVLSQNRAMLDAMHLGVQRCKLVEVESLLAMSQFARDQGVLQESLSATTHCSLVAQQCKDMGINVTAATEVETAKVLWATGEATASVRMLRDLVAAPDASDQAIPVGHAGLLAQLAHQLAQARLESADDILTRYLKPAIKSLGGRDTGEEAGIAFYEFAAFCDRQLQAPGSLEDFARVARLRQKRTQEIEELQTLLRGTKKSGDEKASLAVESSLKKAKQWMAIDNTEFERMKASRDTFVQQSLQNYLLALHASDSHDICALRLFALWLDNAEADDANAIVRKHLPNVPSWKFVVLLNQLMSRLEEVASPFQGALKALARRLCAEHPHHSLHHLYATTRKPTTDNVAANSRFKAAMTVRHTLEKDPRTGDLIARAFKANSYYDAFARDKVPAGRGASIAFREFKIGERMESAIPALRVPPITISLPLQPDGVYNDVPTIASFVRQVTIMGGQSKPKAITAIATDGKEYRQLCKGGADDLRQDAIMEQVFDEVSKMLHKHKATRQRNLHINTYKVVPLTPTSGVLEWVPNSMPIDKFLRAAHKRYHPQDMDSDTARDKIGAAQRHSIETRVKEYQKICSRMQPVMRHFFTERFSDPDEWFAKRTAYTRTTASISMLGHVLGLGDRHCQNIVLNEKSGEVVHIDLGIAFEAGRVLPVPELVPFRLSRDIIDGMGCTKTEGVFRRCCEFTMDALREDKDTIMTLLNVLRYDPLYAWTLSPLRAKRVQNQETERNVAALDEPASSRKKEYDAGEADRALAIVEKKLSKTLSTAATVNELIQQATDERNLATLWLGWSAYY